MPRVRTSDIGREACGTREMVMGGLYPLSSVGAGEPVWITNDVLSCPHGQHHSEEKRHSDDRFSDRFQALEIMINRYSLFSHSVLVYQRILRCMSVSLNRASPAANNDD